MTEPALTSSISNVPALLQHAGDRAAYMRASRAENTRRAYAADWRNFTDLGLVRRPSTPSSSTGDRGPLPGRRGRSRLRPGTLACHLMAITAAHGAAGISSTPVPLPFGKRLPASSARTAPTRMARRPLSLPTSEQ